MLTKNLSRISAQRHPDFDFRQPHPLKRLVLLLGVTILAVLGTALPASATFSNTADATWMTNGIVYAIAQSGNTIYIGGRFTSVRACPVGTTCTGNVVGVNNLAAFDATTGAAIRTFRPAVTGGSPNGSGGTTLPTVYGLAVLGGKLFIGGSFTAVAGQPRRNFAAVDAVTGALNLNITAAVGADATKYVRTVIASDVLSRVYIGGDFLTVGGVARTRLAAFDANGTLDPVWKPRTSTWVKSLVFSCNGQAVIAGGNFRSAAGTGQPLVARATVARFDATTGAIHAWQTPAGAIPNGINAFDLAPTCNRLFVAYGGSNFLYALDLSDDVADILWTIKTGGDVQTVAVRNDRVLFGGHFSQINPVNADHLKRTRFAVVDFFGNADPWAPSFDGSFYGPWEILVRGNQVWVGGAFTTVSGVPQSNIARFTDEP
jgi:hypothetical protein